MCACWIRCGSRCLWNQPKMSVTISLKQPLTWTTHRIIHHIHPNHRTLGSGDVSTCCHIHTAVVVCLFRGIVPAKAYGTTLCLVQSFPGSRHHIFLLTCITILCTYSTLCSGWRRSIRYVSFIQICSCCIFRLWWHFMHISAKCTYRKFFPA